MVKPIPLFLGIFSAFGGIAAASSCIDGVYYCGGGLVHFYSNWYHDEAVVKLQAAGQSTDEKHVDHSLFYCHDGGYINYVQYCGSCVMANHRDNGTTPTASASMKDGTNSINAWIGLGEGK